MAKSAYRRIDRHRCPYCWRCGLTPPHTYPPPSTPRWGCWGQFKEKSLLPAANWGQNALTLDLVHISNATPSAGGKLFFCSSASKGQSSKFKISLLSILIFSPVHSEETTSSLRRGRCRWHVSMATTITCWQPTGLFCLMLVDFQKVPEFPERRLAGPFSENYMARRSKCQSKVRFKGSGSGGLAGGLRVSSCWKISFKY